MPSTDDAITTARAYHEAWTAHAFDRATALLAPALEVEVPINEYPTTASFAAALEGFGAMVEHVDLLAAMGQAQEAMLLYDMRVTGLGTIRIAEHFTVVAGRITRLRQIHDTTLIRRAHLGPVPFRAEVGIADAGRAFAALTTLPGLQGWWTPEVSGSAAPGGELRFAFPAAGEVIRMHVDAVSPETAVTWTCVEHSGAPAWVGSTVDFAVAAQALAVTHHGVDPDHVRDGWEFFLASLAELVATGTGRPFGAG